MGNFSIKTELEKLKQQIKNMTAPVLDNIEDMVERKILEKLGGLEEKIKTIVNNILENTVIKKINELEAMLVNKINEDINEKSKTKSSKKAE